MTFSHRRFFRHRLDAERLVENLSLYCGERIGSLDTLALAYHMIGDTEKAVETQKKVVSLLTDDASREDFEQRLAEFEAAL